MLANISYNICIYAIDVMKFILNHTIKPKTAITAVFFLYTYEKPLPLQSLNQIKNLPKKCKNVRNRLTPFLHYVFLLHLLFIFCNSLQKKV